MTLKQLLTEISLRGIRLRSEQGELLALCSEGAIAPALVGELRAHKIELLGLIDGDSGDWWSPPATITPEMLPLIDLTAAEIETIVTSLPGGTANVQDIYPLAPLQEGILFHHLVGSEGDPYLLAALMAFKDRECLEGYLRAVQTVIDRHDILRTAILWEGLHEPVQVVWRTTKLPVEHVSLDAAAGDVAGQLYARFNPRSYRIDVRQAPLLRASIAYDETEERWLMVLLLHHLAGDQTTLEMMQQEIELQRAGMADRLRPPHPFRNLVAQARLGVPQEEHEAFFRKMLGDVVEPTAAFGLLSAQGDGRGVEEGNLVLDGELSRRLRARARILGVSLASLCHLAWALVLARVSSRDDVVFGTVLFGRMAGENASQVMGPTINTLPVRIQVGANGVASAVWSSHQMLADLLSHEHASLALAQRCSAVAAPAPLFSALLNYRHHDASAERAIGKTNVSIAPGVELLYIEERTNYPVTLSIDDLEDGFSLSALAASPIKPLRICELMRASLSAMIAALETAPSTPLLDLDVLPEQERRQILYAWNDTDASFPCDRCVHQLFETQALETPNAVALVDEARELTFQQLNEQASRVASHLVMRGVKPAEMVVTLLDRSLELIVAQMAVLKAGATYLPIDPGSPAERLASIVNDCGAKIVLSAEPADPAALAGAENVILDEKMRLEGPPATVSLPLSSDAPAYCMYTSGSSGRPKGVMVSHRGIVRLVRNNRYAQFAPGDHVAFAASPAFDGATMEVWAPLLNGGRIIIIGREVLLDPAVFAAALDRHNVNVLLLTVGLFNQYAGSLSGQIPRLRYLLVGGDALDARIVARTLQRNAPQHFLNAYGPTEATTIATTYEITAVPENARSIPIGRPIGNTKIYILDRHGRPVPVGVEGEIYIGGVGVALGYLGRPELTAASFLADPFAPDPGARMYKTGDLAKWLEDGTIDFVGRHDFQVKIRGYRIELGEIEAALLEHPDVRQAVVLAHETCPGGKQLDAYFVARNAAQPVEISSLRKFLKQQLPDYMVPASLVQLQSLPLTSNGKVDRKALPLPERSPADETSHSGPRTMEEEMVAGVFAEVLGREYVGIDEDFFELGGHSLLATQVVSRVRSVLGIDLALRQLFESPTVRGVAEVLRGARTDESSQQIPRLDRPQPLPLSFAQERLWFLDQLSPGDIAYNIPLAVRIEGELNTAALESSINDIVRRHEALRTRFPSVDGEPCQLIEQWTAKRLEVINLGPCDESEIRSRAMQEARKCFHLATGPLLRAQLLRCGEQLNVFLLTLHHIIGDGWSLRILVRELKELYDAYCQGREADLPELSVQYADYSVWQKHWLNELFLGELEYWKSQLAGMEALELPVDRARPATMSSWGSVYALNLEKELAAQLARFTREQGVTLYMALLSILQALLYRYTGQTDFGIGSPVAGRTRTEMEGIIGLFVNTLVLRVRIDPQRTFRQQVREVKETALQAYAHQHIPFEKLVELLAPDRNLDRSPIFQVMFVLQDNFAGELRLGNARLSPLAVDTGTAKFELTLSLETGRDGLSGVFEYNTDLFDASTIARMARHFCMLLSSALAEPERPLAMLPLLTETEREQMLSAWNRTGPHTVLEGCVHQLFEAQAARTPHLLALMHEGGEISYQELNRRSNQLARCLQKKGVSLETRVGICLERGPELLIALLAVLKAGGAYVPLDPAYPRERLAYMLEDSQAELLLTQREMGLPMASCRSRCLQLESVSEEIDQQDTANLNASVNPENLSWVIYTSGSTGRPKGSGIRHRSAVIMLCWAREVFSDTELSGVLAGTSSCFDISVFELFAPICWGGAVIMAENVLQLPVLRHAKKVRLVNTVPSAMIELVRTGGVPATVATINLAGEALQRSLVDEIYRATEVRRVLNLYGPSEDTTFSTYAEVKRGESITIGRPLWQTQLYVLDPQLQPVPIGAKGELYISGSGLSRGYLNRPELTAARFVPNIFAEGGERMYRTGDLVRYLPDGNLEFLGRFDHQVKVRGYRIELGEVEHALLEHPAVQQAVVVVREDQPGGKRLIAYVVGKTAAAPLEIDDLRNHLQPRLPQYMVPSAFVLLDRLPLNSNGKIDRKALPRPEQRMETAVYVGPRTQDEEVLCEIWAELLGTGRVGVQDNFFRLGGNSLLSVRLMARIQKIWGKALPLGLLFQSGTIEHLARLLAQEPAVTCSPLVQLRAGYGQPFFCVHPVGGNVLCYATLAQSIGPEWSLYGLQARGLESGLLPDCEVEVMAARYIREIRSVQGAGPYFIGGWSFGGLVAFEMAQQLHAHGEKVALLTLFDTRLPDQMGITQLDDSTLVDEFAMDLGLPSRSSQESDSFTLDQRLEAVLQEARSANLFPPEEGMIFVKRLFDVFAANLRAAIKYRPASYDGHVVLFTAQQRFSETDAGSIFVNFDPSYGWRKFFGDLESYSVPGDHYSMMITPNVETFAAQLNLQLGQANSESMEPLNRR